MTFIKFSLTTSDILGADFLELEKQAPKKVLRAINRKITPPLERALDRTLRRYPPPRTPASPPFVWSYDKTKNERARRWFFANYPAGYTRTGALGRNWKSSIELAAGGVIEIAVENDSRAASYVYGSDTYGQVPGHETTGWFNAADEVTEYGLALEDDLLELWDDIVSQYL